MHEITLCQRALELIEQQAVQNHAKRVLRRLAEDQGIFLRRDQRPDLLF